MNDIISQIENATSELPFEDGDVTTGTLCDILRGEDIETQVFIMVDGRKIPAEMFIVDGAKGECVIVAKSPSVEG